MEDNITLVAREDDEYYQRLPIEVVFDPDLPDTFALSQLCEVEGLDCDLIVMTPSQALDLANWIIDKLEGAKDGE